VLRLILVKITEKTEKGITPHNTYVFNMTTSTQTFGAADDC